MTVTKVNRITFEYECLSTDTLPIVGVAQGAHAYETNTGKKYEFHGVAWQEWFDTHTFPRFCDEQTKTLDTNGNIDIRSDAFTVAVTLSAYSGTADTLNTITGLKTGQQVIFIADTGDTITLDISGTYTMKNAIDENTILNDVDDRWGGIYNGTNLVELFIP